MVFLSFLARLPLFTLSSDPGISAVRCAGTFSVPFPRYYPLVPGFLLIASNPSPSLVLPSPRPFFFYDFRSEAFFNPRNAEGPLGCCRPSSRSSGPFFTEMFSPFLQLRDLSFVAASFHFRLINRGSPFLSCSFWKVQKSFFPWFFRKGSLPSSPDLPPPPSSSPFPFSTFAKNRQFFFYFFFPCLRSFLVSEQPPSRRVSRSRYGRARLGSRSRLFVAPPCFLPWWLLFSFPLSFPVVVLRMRVAYAWGPLVRGGGRSSLLCYGAVPPKLIFSRKPPGSPFSDGLMMRFGLLCLLDL